MVGGDGVVLIPDLYIHSTRPLLIMCMLMGCQQKHGRMNIKTILRGHSAEYQLPSTKGESLYIQALKI